MLEPTQRQELVAGLSRQVAGGMRNPGSYRRVLAHGDLRVRIRGTQQTGFGIVIYDQDSGPSVAGHLKAGQLVKFIGHLAQPKTKRTPRADLTSKHT